MLIIGWSTYDIVKQFMNKYNRRALSILNFFIGRFISGVGRWATKIRAGEVGFVCVCICMDVFIYTHTYIHICSFCVEKKREFVDLFTLLQILNIISSGFYTSSFRLYRDYRTATSRCVVLYLTYIWTSLCAIRLCAQSWSVIGHGSESCNLEASLYSLLT